MKRNKKLKRKSFESSQGKRIHHRQSRHRKDADFPSSAMGCGGAAFANRVKQGQKTARACWPSCVSSQQAESLSCRNLLAPNSNFLYPVLFHVAQTGVFLASWNVLAQHTPMKLRLAPANDEGHDGCKGPQATTALRSSQSRDSALCSCWTSPNPKGPLSHPFSPRSSLLLASLLTGGQTCKGVKVAIKPVPATAIWWSQLLHKCALPFLQFPLTA